MSRLPANSPPAGGVGGGHSHTQCQCRILPTPSPSRKREGNSTLATPPAIALKREAWHSAKFRGAGAVAPANLLSVYLPPTALVLVHSLHYIEQWSRCTAILAGRLRSMGAIMVCLIFTLRARSSAVRFRSPHWT